RFVCAPTNHLKVGGVQSSTRSHLRNHGNWSAARPQNASGSLFPSSIHFCTIGLTRLIVISLSPSQRDSQSGPADPEGRFEALMPTSPTCGELRIRGVDSPSVDGPRAVTRTTMMCDGDHSMQFENDIMFRPMFCGQA